MAQDINVIEGLDTAFASRCTCAAGHVAQRAEDPPAPKRSCASTRATRRSSCTSVSGKILRLADEFCVDLDRVVGELRVAFGHDAVML